MYGKAQWVRVSWMAGALLPLMAGIISAANNSPAPQTRQPMRHSQQMAPSPEQSATFQLRLEKAKDLIGSKVYSQQGEQLGKIEDVVLTPDRQGVNYVVLSHGGVASVGDKYFAIPYSQFTPGTGEKAKTFILKGNISKADLDRAPGFDKKAWPVRTTENWLAMERSPSMPSSSEMTPAPAERGTNANPAYGRAQPLDIQHFRLSKLFGTMVRDAQNENVGKLDNAIIDLSHGKVAYGIVALQRGSMYIDKDFAALPWSALGWTSERSVVKLNVNVDPDTLAFFAFNRDSFPNFADPQYSRQLFERFHATPYWESPSLGFIPGDKNRSGNLPSSKMVPPDSGMTAPNSAPNVAVPQTVEHRDSDRYGSPYGYGYDPYRYGYDPYRYGYDGYRYGYNQSAVQTFYGRVTRVNIGRLPGTSMEEVGLTVEASNGRTIQVDVGPHPWVDHQRIYIRQGDPVTITGSLARVGDRTVFLASRIQTPNRIFNLRTPDGTPLWSLDRSWHPQAYSRDYDRYDHYASPYGHPYSYGYPY